MSRPVAITKAARHVLVQSAMAHRRALNNDIDLLLIDLNKLYRQEQEIKQLRASLKSLQESRDMITAALDELGAEDQLPAASASAEDSGSRS